MKNQNLISEVKELQRQLARLGHVPRQGKEDLTEFRSKLKTKLAESLRRNPPRAIKTRTQTPAPVQAVPEAFDAEAELAACYTVYPDGTRICDQERLKRLAFTVKHTPQKKPEPSETQRKAQEMIAGWKAAKQYDPARGFNRAQLTALQDISKKGDN